MRAAQPAAISLSTRDVVAKAPHRAAPPTGVGNLVPPVGATESVERIERALATLRPPEALSAVDPTGRQGH